jgi:hypothetical protein
VPYVDPDGGGVDAKVLFLLRDPSDVAASKTGLISPDNPDPTADNFTWLRDQVGIDPRACVAWNVVPWFIGNRDQKRQVVFIRFPEKQPPPEFGGRFVSGTRPDQRITLLWGTVEDDGTFTEFFPVWLRLRDIDEALITEALILQRPLVGRFALTRSDGRVRSHVDITWAVTS